tara:strand:+ start:18086 stop:19624 length:1539 start_codon:yes stop_codon:yes gene_type:complete
MSNPDGMRETYDVIVIGGGHNGLVAAIELTRGGLTVCVLEERDLIGGCAITTEPLLAGFKHSPHANCFVFSDLLPSQIGLSTLGVGAIQPEAQLGVTFADGRAPVILHRPDLLAETEANLAEYSKRDASRYVEMKRRSAELQPILKTGLYAPPERAWFEKLRRKVLNCFGDLIDEHQLGCRSAQQLIDGLFETPEIRLLLYNLAAETGLSLTEQGSDLAFLGWSLWIAGRWRVPVGGMQVYSEALANAARNAGVTLMTATPVDRVLVRQGRATGVHTRDGREIAAREGVVSATPLLSLFDDMMSKKHISHIEQAELNTFRQSSLSSIGTTAFCLSGPPRYKSAQYDPDIDRCLKTIIGFETPNEMIRQFADIDRGLLPHPAGTVRVHSLWDTSLAPPGQHITAVDSALPAIGHMDRRQWRQVEAVYPSAFLDTWQNYLVEAPSVPAMAMSLDDKFGFERRMLMRLGRAQYRTSTKGLYLAGPGIYPGGGVHGGCGFNSANVILSDIADATRR